MASRMMMDAQGPVRRQRRDQKQQHHQHGGRSFGHAANENLKPSDVNQKVIAAAESGNPLALLDTIGEHLWRMNLVNLSTSIHRLAKCADRDPEHYLAVTQSPVFEELVKLLSARLMNAHGQACLHQTLSNVTWSLAHLYTPDMKLLGQVASMSIHCMDGFKPFELSMLLWGFAKTGIVEEMPQVIEALFRTAGARIMASLGQFSFRSLAMIAWAFATARQRQPRLFSGVANEMRRNASAANCQEVGNTVWAFASAGHRDRKLLTVMAEVAVPLISEFKAQEISNMLWGFATLGFFHEQVFTCSINAALRMELGSQHLAIILWACSKAMPKHPAMQDLVITFAPLCIMRLGTFKPQEVSSTVQALAKVLLPEKEEKGEADAVTPRAWLADYTAPLHEDVMMLLEALAHWVACHSTALTPNALVTAVSSLVMLGVRAGRRSDALLEQSVLTRVHEISLADKVPLLEAFLGPPCVAKGVTSVLSASLASSLDSLHHKDYQTLVRLYRTSRRTPSGADDPPRAELTSWCLALAAGLPFATMMQGNGPCEPEAIPDAISVSDSSSEVSILDPALEAPAGSEFHVETAESLPFMYWHPQEHPQEA